MDYVGWVVLARGDSELRRAPAVSAFGGAVGGERVFGDWRELRISDTGTGDADVCALARTTGAPALAVYVVDGLCAIGEGATPDDGDPFDVVFGEERATEQYAAALPDDYRRADAVAAVTAWAAQADLAAAPDAIDRALAHGGLDDLYRALGLTTRAPAH
ncbi:hypothetical protein [Yinghuangia sp. YIM S09857]|uniref:hypothetical protein n=1 Tax=Yinghuangia sp. YIM S09857 TaxID=3436929 RepID=UPI003F53215D